MGKYLEKAKEIRAIVEPHHNCAQSVLMAFLDDLDLDRETAYKLGSCFGSGMKCGSTCGAITGALMAMGLLGLDSPEITQKFFRDFKWRGGNADKIGSSQWNLFDRFRGGESIECFAEGSYRRYRKQSVRFGWRREPRWRRRDMLY